VDPSSRARAAAAAACIRESTDSYMTAVGQQTRGVTEPEQPPITAHHVPAARDRPLRSLFTLQLQYCTVLYCTWGVSDTRRRHVLPPRAWWAGDRVNPTSPALFRVNGCFSSLHPASSVCVTTNAAAVWGFAALLCPASSLPCPVMHDVGGHQAKAAKTSPAARPGLSLFVSTGSPVRFASAHTWRVRREAEDSPGPLRWVGHTRARGQRMGGPVPPHGQFCRCFVVVALRDYAGRQTLAVESGPDIWCVRGGGDGGLTEFEGDVGDALSLGLNGPKPGQHVSATRVTRLQQLDEYHKIASTTPSHRHTEARSSVTHQGSSATRNSHLDIKDDSSYSTRRHRHFTSKETQDRPRTKAGSTRPTHRHDS